VQKISRLEGVVSERQEFPTILESGIPAAPGERQLLARVGEEAPLRVHHRARLPHIDEAVGDLLRGAQQRFVILVDRFVIFGAARFQLAAQQAA
jgi:hypothetical protein